MYCDHALSRLRQRFRFSSRVDLENIRSMLFNCNKYIRVECNENNEEKRKITYKKKTMIAIIRNGLIITFLPDRNSRDYWMNLAHEYEEKIKELETIKTDMGNQIVSLCEDREFWKDKVSIAYSRNIELIRERSTVRLMSFWEWRKWRKK